MINGISVSRIDHNLSNADQTADRNEIEGLWTIGELIKELYSLSEKCIDYKRGLVKLPSVKERQILIQQNIECTFAPKINNRSQKVDQQNWKERIATEIDNSVTLST